MLFRSGKEKEEPPNKSIKALIINFNLDAKEQETLEIFLTTFRPFTDSQAFNIMTVLANYSFIHLFTPKNHFTSTPIMDVTDYKQDPFTYITTERYTLKEFYGVIINTGTFKKSTVGYRQYLAYKATINNNTDINITQTRAINV